MGTLGRLCADAKLAGMTPHVLRHSFASVAGNLVLRAHHRGSARPRGATQRYVHIDEAVRMAADRVSAEITRLLDGAQLKNQTRSFKRTLNDIAEIGAWDIENGEPPLPQLIL